MDATTGGTPTIQYHNIPEQPISATLVSSPGSEFQRKVRHCFGDVSPGEFPLAAKPSILLHVLSSCNLFPQDLAKLEATCSFFRQPAQIGPDHDLNMAELAALDMCKKRAVFNSMTTEQKEAMKLKCGGTWKLVLKYLLAGEACYRREKSQAIAGPCHSIAVTSNGDVYSFGANKYGQLGHGQTAEGNLKDESTPRLISSLQGIRIIQAAVGACRTMLISDAGKVYAFGKDIFGEGEQGGPFPQGPKVVVDTPKVVESLKDIFVVQATIAHYFTAVLSREGRVYTFSWGSDERLGHRCDPNNVQPHPLLGPLENIQVVQIAAGNCYLLALAWQPSGMSVYSVGCGQGGKLGHGIRTDEKVPRLISAFQDLSLEPVLIAAGAWHAAMLSKDGRVCTWGWGRHGCLGHGGEEYEMTPKVVEALSGVNAVHVATGDNTTFVVSDDGAVYAFGCGDSSNLGHVNTGTDEQANTHKLLPELVSSLNHMKERIVQISPTTSVYRRSHTFVLTESGKLYAFGAAEKGQLGIKLGENQTEMSTPRLVDLNL